MITRLDAAMLGLLLMAAGCDSLPERGEARKLAIGTITMSTPMFSPMKISDGNDRLDFGALRNEQNLAIRVESPSVGMTGLSFDAIQASVRAAMASEGLKPETVSDEELKTLIPPAVSDAMAKLMAKSGTKFSLTPDQLATYVAAYKTYMVNLEDYYNFENLPYFDATSEGHLDWLAYKAHFTVSVQPGWYTRMNPYEADITINFDHPAKLGQVLKVLYVMPSESAQALEELQAALRQVETLGQMGVSAPQFNMKAAVQAAKAAGERLEGLKTNTTMVVGYPRANSINVRFRRTVVPDFTRYDLQPITRVLTAVVMIRSKPGESRNSAAYSPNLGNPEPLRPKMPSPQPEDGTSKSPINTELEEAIGLMKNIANDGGRDAAGRGASLEALRKEKEKIQGLQAPPGKERRRKTVLDALDDTMNWVEALGRDSSPANTVVVRTVSRFVGTQYDNRDIWLAGPGRAAHAMLPDGANAYDTQNLVDQPPYEASVEVPVPLYPKPAKQIKKLAITAASGFYWRQDNKVRAMVLCTIDNATDKDVSLDLKGDDLELDHSQVPLDLGRGNRGLLQFGLKTEPNSTGHVFVQIVAKTTEKAMPNNEETKTPAFVEASVAEVVPVGARPESPSTKPPQVTIDHNGVKMDATSLRDLTPDMVRALLGVAATQPASGSGR
jgi:hypothetical protein